MFPQTDGRNVIMGHWGYVSTDADIPYPAWIDDRHWNGFAMPFFTRDVVDRVIADTDGWARFAVEDGVPTVRTTDDDPSCSVDDVAVPLVEVDGVTLYGVGAGSWVWGEVVSAFTITCPHGTWSAGPTHRTAIAYATREDAERAARVHFEAHGCRPTVHDDPRSRRDYVGGAS